MENLLNQPGLFSWTELLTTDPEAAKAFYGPLFHWQLERAPNTPPGVDYTLAKLGDQAIAGIMAIPPEARGMPPHWGTYITVADVDATVAQALALGGTICCPPQDIPQVGRFSVLQDPQGAVFGIISYSSEPC